MSKFCQVLKNIKGCESSCPILKDFCSTVENTFWVAYLTAQSILIAKAFPSTYENMLRCPSQ